MAGRIHQTAIVAAGAQLGEEVEVAPYAIIEDNVTIGDNCRIGPHTLVAWGARLGQGVAVHKGAVVGSIPQDLKFAGEESTLEVGDNTIIREYATLNRGTVDRHRTTVGHNCLLMAYSHIAHDCIIGNHVILANSVNLAGHIEIGDHAIIGGVVPVHQFVKIGAHAMIGGGFRVPMDIVPYAMCGGYPLQVMGLNRVGLKRRGFSPDVIKTLEQVFRLLFKSKMNTAQAVARIREEIEMIDEVRLILDFIESSERGICK
ncbi:MAG: acyl-ACP--UDP-N-acetylglucosamine O-acyltransferase [candidate division Zixibacteria bacterium]|nr:acyl-ACP--UDP-N-acetylglucosamine O-acyltransferase [candidate division Zixibacteria bacterium]